MAHIHATGFYMVGAYKGMLSGTINGVASLTAVGRELYECCSLYEFEFATPPTDGLMFLTVDSMQIGSSVSGAMDDYVIEWRLNSRTGEIVFVTGEGTDPAIQAQHPVTDEVVFAGILYPIIRYVWIDGVQYVAHWEDMDSDSLYAPDLVYCLDPITVTAIECDTILGTDLLYPYYLTYDNEADIGVDKSRKLKYNICGSDSEPMVFLAWEFQAYQISDQIKIYYCTLEDSDGVLVDNFISGSTDLGTLSYYPTGYPTNPRKVNSQSVGTQPLAFITDLRDFTYTEGDYVRIEITGSVMSPSVSNTNWYLKLKALAETDLNCNFPMDSGQNKITSTPTMNWTSDPTCQYYAEYTTEDAGPGFVARTNSAVAAYPIYKYLGAFHNGYWYGTSGYPNTYTNSNVWTSPVRLGMRWNIEGQASTMISIGFYTNCVNIASGQTITVTKTTSAVTYTFTDVTDYNLMVSDFTALYAHANYAVWQSLPDTDAHYYAMLNIYIRVANSCGDTQTTYSYFIWIGNTPTYDPVNMTVTISLDVPTNNYSDSECSSIYETIVTALTQATTFKNLSIPGGSYVTKVRGSHYFGAQWINGISRYDTQKTIGFGMAFEEFLLNDLCDPALWGFCKITDTSTNKIWVLPKYEDRVTFLSTTTHTDRLNNWMLERRVSLRTDNCSDWTTWEIVHSETAMRSTSAGVAAVTGRLQTTTMYGDVEGDASVSGTLKPTLFATSAGRASVSGTLTEG